MTIVLEITLHKFSNEIHFDSIFTEYANGGCNVLDVYTEDLRFNKDLSKNTMAGHAFEVSYPSAVLSPVHGNVDFGSVRKRSSMVKKVFQSLLAKAKE